MLDTLARIDAIDSRFLLPEDEEKEGGPSAGTKNTTSPSLCHVVCSAADPSDPLHHLEKHRGKWWLRVRVFRNNRKLEGKRENIPLHTSDLQVATRRRDRMLADFAKHGFLSERVLSKIGVDP